MFAILKCCLGNDAVNWGVYHTKILSWTKLKHWRNQLKIKISGELEILSYCRKTQTYKTRQNSQGCNWM